MAVDKVVDSTQLDADLTSVANAIRAKSGGSGSLAFPAGFVSEIGDIPSGGGEETFVSPATGLRYTANMVIPETATEFAPYLLKGASELVSLEANALKSAYVFAQAMQNCTKLESVAFPRQTTYQGGNTNTFTGCTALKSLQLGSIGYPVTTIHFNAKSNSQKTVTIYCTSIASVSIDQSPVDSGDTVVYRDSTTGEVQTA